MREFADIPYLRSLFHNFNRLFFKESLPEPEFEFRKAKSYLGKYSFVKRNVWSPIHSDDITHKITISTFYELSERDLQNTMLHEMIHYYITYNKIHDTGPHGKVFRAIKDMINSHGWKVTVSAKASDKELQTICKPFVVILLKDLKDEAFVITTSTTTAPRLRAQIMRVSGLYDVEYFITIDPELNKYPKARTLRGRRVSEEEYEQTRKLLMEYGQKWR